MTLVSEISDLATRIGTEFKTVRTERGVLASLSTTDKSSIVAAINEIFAAIGSGGTIDADAITDSTVVGRALIRAADALSGRTTLDVYSKAETDAAASAAAAALVDGAPGTLDTLNELAAALGDDPNAITTINTAIGNRVRHDVNNQGLTGTQMSNARTNIAAVGTADIGDTATDFVPIFEAALI